jgi:Cdc6-like AAA superfamily ATPase
MHTCLVPYCTRLWLFNFCSIAAQVAALSGDIRVALNLCRRSLEVSMARTNAEMNAVIASNKSSSSSTSNSSSSSSAQKSKTTVQRIDMVVSASAVAPRK